MGNITSNISVDTASVIRQYEEIDWLETMAWRAKRKRDRELDYLVRFADSAGEHNIARHIDNVGKLEEQISEIEQAIATKRVKLDSVLQSINTEQLFVDAAQHFGYNLDNTQVTSIQAKENNHNDTSKVVEAEPNFTG